MKKVSENVCDQEIFNGLFLSIAPKLRNYLVYKFRFLSQADDLVQEAFAVLWQNCMDVKPALAQAYLYKVANNGGLKILSKEKVRKNYLQQNLEIVDRQDPAFHMQYEDLAKKLSQAIDQLPDGQREVFLMNRMDNITYVEIAGLLNISVKSVEKRMHKALIKLREICGGI